MSFHFPLPTRPSRLAGFSAPNLAFWRSHLLFPALAWLLLVALVHHYRWDEAISHAFYDSTLRRWTWGESLWANELLYHHGRRLIFTIAALALGAALRRDWRRPASYLLLCMGLSTGLAGLFKHATNMDCPRDMSAFGGTRPDLGLFETRPAGLPPGRCFPGGHSSGGFSLLALYFLLRKRGRWPARAGLAAGLGLGASFAVAQWARGAHFPSHDLCSAAVAWLVALSVYTVLYRRRVWNPAQPARPPTHAPAAD